MKSTTAFFKGLDIKFRTVSYTTDIFIIAIEQDIFFSMTASVVEIYIQENQQQNLHLEVATQSWSREWCSQNPGKIQGKYLRRSALFCKAAG